MAPEYEFSVVAVNKVGDGPSSNSVKATPLGPVGTPVPTATPGDGQVALSWPDVSTGGRTLAGYTVLYREAGTPVWTTLTTTATSPTTVPGLTNGTQYEFGVIAAATDGTSSNLGTTSATPSTVPGAPVTTAAPGDGKVELTWTVPPDGGHHRLHRRVPPEGTDGVDLRPLPRHWDIHHHSGLSNGTTYEFRVAATNANGPGPFSKPTEATPMVAPTPTPTPTTSATTSSKRSPVATSNWVAATPARSLGSGRWPRAPLSAGSRRHGSAESCRPRSPEPKEESSSLPIDASPVHPRGKAHDLPRSAPEPSTMPAGF